jgi:hypothetical protein
MTVASSHQNAAQKQQLEENHGTALAVQQALETLRVGELYSLAEGIAALREQAVGSIASSLARTRTLT